MASSGPWTHNYHPNPGQPGFTVQYQIVPDATAATIAPAVRISVSCERMEGAAC